MTVPHLDRLQIRLLSTVTVVIKTERIMTPVIVTSLTVLCCMTRFPSDKNVTLVFNYILINLSASTLGHFL